MIKEKIIRITNLDLNMGFYVSSDVDPSILNLTNLFSTEGDYVFGKDTLSLKLLAIYSILSSIAYDENFSDEPIDVLYIADMFKDWVIPTPDSNISFSVSKCDKDVELPVLELIVEMY